MNDQVITTERLKQLEGIEEAYAKLMTDHITLKANNRALKEKVELLKAQVKLMDGYGNH